MRIVVISDTHNLHRQVTLPEGDLLIHAGDFTISGGGSKYGGNPYDIDVIRDFNGWLGEQPHRYKIVIAGNHDRFFEDCPEEARALLTNARMLQDEVVEIEGLKLYGSPWTPTFPPGNRYWKFNKARGSEIAAVWRKIPDDLDVLITHGPPLGIRDFLPSYERSGQLCGDNDLYAEVLRAKPRIHVFGHIHAGYGAVSIGALGNKPTHFYNASQCDEDYAIVNRPWVIDYEKETRCGSTGERSSTDRSGSGEADIPRAA